MLHLQSEMTTNLQDTWDVAVDTVDPTASMYARPTVADIRIYIHDSLPAPFFPHRLGVRGAEYCVISLAKLMRERDDIRLARYFALSVPNPRKPYPN